MQKFGKTTGDTPAIPSGRLALQLPKHAKAKVPGPMLDPTSPEEIEGCLIYKMLNETEFLHGVHRACAA